MKKHALDFDPDRMIAELGELVKDTRKGDLSKYRITHIEKTPVSSIN
jgi:hypothetical protein